MRIAVIIVFFILLVRSNAFSQYNSQAVEMNAEKVICTNFGKRLRNATFLLYGIEDKLIIIEKRKEDYHLFYIKEGIGIEDSVRIGKRKKVLKIAFSDHVCTQNTFVLNDTLKAHPHSRYIHFYEQAEGIVKCSFTLPALFSVDVGNKKVYPLDEKVHKFLVQKMFSKWKY